MARGRRYQKLTIAFAGSILEVIQAAGADDVDGFGKMFLTLLMGIDEAKRWLYLRGGIL